MQKRAAFTLLFGTLISILSFIPATADDGFDFRQANWGTTKEEVQKTETGEVIGNNENLLVINGGLMLGMPCHIGYGFVENKLVRAKYFFLGPHTNKNDYLNDYDKLKSYLITG